MPVDYVKLRKLVGTQMTDDQLSLFAEQGQLIVDENLTDSGLSDAVKNSIALFIAGHFYVLSVEGGGVVFSKRGQSEEKYRGVAADKVGFMSTRFGQQACSLDVTGVLVGLSTQTTGRAIFSVVRRSETTAAEET